MNSKTKKIIWKLIRLGAKISGIWLFVALWWALMLISPMQIHNGIIRHDLPMICIGMIILILCGFWKKGKISFRSEKRVWVLPLVLIGAIDLVSIFYFRNITLSFILTTLYLFLMGQIIDSAPLTQIGFTLFLSSLGLGITHVMMVLLRGRPWVGTRFFAHQISLFFNLFGKRADVVSGALIFQGKKITCDLIKMGFFPWLAFSIVFIVFVLMSSGDLKKRLFVIIGGIFIHYLYLLTRFSFIASITPNTMYAGFGPFNLFYWRILLLTFLPLILLWFFLLYESDLMTFKRPFYTLSPNRMIKRDFWVFFSVLISVLFFTLSLLFYGFSRPRKIHCIIDEVHSDWESTLIDFNQNILGTMAENSYHSFLDYLRHFCPVTVMTNKPVQGLGLEGVELFHASIIRRDILAKIRDRHPDTHPLLILKCITTPFTFEEIEILKDFVFEGGSLFLIGDHTDVFFMNKNLNELSVHFGIRFKQNAVYFVDGGWVITDTSDHCIHPANQYLKRFIWATGDSLQLSSPAFPLIYSSHVCFADEVNYFHENFFGNTKIDADEIFGSFCLMAGAKYGRGKVMAFTDSTCFNNYLMFTVGRRPLIAGMLGWLGNKTRTNPFPLVAYMSFCFLGVVLIKRWPGIDKFVYWGIIGAITGWILGFGLSFSLNTMIYSKPEHVRPFPEEVLMDASHNPLHPMSYGNSESFLSPISYDSLLFNIGRINVFPRIHYQGTISKEALKETSCLIIASPRKDYSVKEKRDIQYFIKEGGTLLLIEGSNPHSTINQIANLFDLHFRLDPYRDRVQRMKAQLINHNRNGLKINPAWVDGGRVIFESEQMPMICFKYEDKGMIVAIGDDGLFMKSNAKEFGMEQIYLQCNVIKALINKDESLLRSMKWDYLKGIF